MNNQGILVVVSGFSGAGKGTLIKALLEKYDNYALSISATTRQPRQGEENGREYFFVTREKFEQMIKQKQLIEYAQYVNNYYGTPKEYVSQKMAEGMDVILEIEIQGALKIKEQFPEALLLFVVPPSAGELRRRLIRRGTESAEVIRARLCRAADEAQGMSSYDYLLVNDDIDTCVENMHQMVRLHRFRTTNNQAFIGKMQKELNATVLITGQLAK